MRAPHLPDVEPSPHRCPEIWVTWQWGVGGAAAQVRPPAPAPNSTHNHRLPLPIQDPHLGAGEQTVHTGGGWRGALPLAPNPLLVMRLASPPSKPAHQQRQRIALTNSLLLYAEPLPRSHPARQRRRGRTRAGIASRPPLRGTWPHTPLGRTRLPRPMSVGSPSGAGGPRPIVLVVRRGGLLEIPGREAMPASHGQGWGPGQRWNPGGSWPTPNRSI
jgi:hypothetical protein